MLLFLVQASWATRFFQSGGNGICPKKLRQQLSTGIVYFVGAGPGHPGLITLRGVECLRKADAVLYDYLANARTIHHAHPDAELVCLGRHRRSDVWSQQAINDEMVRRASAGQRVVRLKGGDPMIFGRAAEEIAALNQAGIPFEIVPGVTTASAASAFTGVPITDRRFASAVALVTGHEQLGKPDSSLDYQSLANFPGTLIIYMGVRTVEQWTTRLLDAGKPADTPVLIVRRVSWPDQQSMTCELGDVIDRLTPYQKFPPPVVVIIGEIARAAPEFDWFHSLPLLGQGILVTRPEHQAEGMVDRLSELGANPIVQPAIAIHQPREWSAVDAAIDSLHDFDYVVFSSSNGVHAFIRRLFACGHDVRKLGHSKLAVTGPKTADTLKEYSLIADIQPSSFRAEAVVDAVIHCSDNSENPQIPLQEKLAGKRFLLLRASRGREALAERIQSAGGYVEQVVVYESVDIEVADETVEEAWQRGDVHWVTVTSSAIARSVCRMWGERLRDVKLASISPITSETLRELGFEPTVEATTFTTDGLIDAIVKASA